MGGFFPWSVNPLPHIKTAATLSDLAWETGLPADTLADTVRRYNVSIDQGLERDPDFGRPLAKRRKVEKPPFFAP